MKLGCLVAVAAAATASPVGSIDDYARSIEQRGSINEKDFGNLKFYVQHAAAAYCNVDKKPGDLISGSWTGIAGYVALDHARREIVLSLRGSNNLRNFITDVLFAWQDCDFVRECKVHTGFAKAWEEIADAATRGVNAARSSHRDYKVVITGHSLGGAVATLAGAYLRRQGLAADVYTFGSPRVGNDHFANWMTSQPGNQWRVTHRDDPVPRLPPIFIGYRHISPEYWLAGGRMDQNDYRIGDVKFCDGIANTGCNGGTFGLNIISHLHYLGETAGCAPFPLNWKRDSQGVSNEELEQRLNEWSQKDQDFVKNHL
ncbi:lipase [Purpureocillium lavendulum]|uniref:Lipase n=1 Tax=Purpureocillium lavendulum TaxID=1247861 RepID=A0AB34FM97_9HYPO|nr:lipase [Purpureocillium lavendulum]